MDRPLNVYRRLQNKDFDTYRIVGLRDSFPYLTSKDQIAIFVFVTWGYFPVPSWAYYSIAHLLVV